jgi:hypothetical protein
VPSCVGVHVRCRSCLKTECGSSIEWIPAKKIRFAGLGWFPKHKLRPPISSSPQLWGRGAVIPGH